MVKRTAPSQYRPSRQGCHMRNWGPARRVVANLARCPRNPSGIALRPAPSGRAQPRGNSVASIWSETALGRLVVVPYLQNIAVRVAKIH